MTHTTLLKSQGGSMKPGAQLRMLITELSKTKEGFTPDDAEHIKASSTYVSKVCCTMIAQGLLFRSKAAGYPVRYHDTQYSSWAWEANTPARKRVRIRKSRAKIKLIKIKLIKVIKVIKAKPVEPKQTRPSINYVPRTKVPVEIVHTATTRYSSRMMTDRYAVSVPFARMGGSGNFMSVGGAG